MTTTKRMSDEAKAIRLLNLFDREVLNVRAGNKSEILTPTYGYNDETHEEELKGYDIRVMRPYRSERGPDSWSEQKCRERFAGLSLSQVRAGIKWLEENSDRITTWGRGRRIRVRYLTQAQVDRVVAVREQRNTEIAARDLLLARLSALNVKAGKTRGHSTRKVEVSVESLNTLLKGCGLIS